MPRNIEYTHPILYFASKTPVFVMPKMKKFIEGNAPWSQLVNSKNISLNLMKNESFIRKNLTDMDKKIMATNKV